MRITDGAIPGVTSITRNYNGGAGNSSDAVAVGGWNSTTQIFAHVEFHPPLLNNVSTLSYSANSDFNIYDAGSNTFQPCTGIFLGHGGKNGCYITATIASALATPGRFAELVAVTTSASITFS